MNMESALLLQKVEFLEMELEEVRRREDNLKKVNNSLMAAINSEPGILKDQTLNELQKANDQYLSELSTIKKQHKDEVLGLEKQVQELFLAKKDLQIDLKRLKTSAESEKYELLTIIKQYESEKLSLSKQKTDSSLLDKNTKERFRLTTEKSLSDSRGFYNNKENDALKGKIEELTTKLKSKKEKIKRLKERNNEKSLRIRIEELENELEECKALCKKQNSGRTDRNVKKELEEAQALIDKLKKGGGDKAISELKCALLRKEEEIKEVCRGYEKKCEEMQEAVEGLNNYKIKLQQSEIYWAMNEEKRAETEFALKNEIKFLIGKLLKAKSKLNVEDANESSMKNSMVATVKNKSMQRKSGKIISPLDLSVITRSESPFCLSHIDI